MKPWYLVPVLSCVLAAAPSNERLNVPFIHQQKNGCGAASVAMVAQYWEGQSAASAATLSAEKVYQDLYDSNRKGILLVDMRRYLQEQGFQAFTIRGQVADLQQHVDKGRPIIVGLKPGKSKRIHFAVLLGFEGDHVWLNDPTKKKATRQKQTDFVNQWAAGDRWMLLASPARPQ